MEHSNNKPENHQYAFRATLEAVRIHRFYLYQQMRSCIERGVVENLVVVPASVSWQARALEKTASILISTFTLHQKMMSGEWEKKATNGPIQLHRFSYLRVILDYVPICDSKLGEVTSGEQRADSSTYF